jgi:hypothetical protein
LCHQCGCFRAAAVAAVSDWLRQHLKHAGRFHQNASFSAAAAVAAVSEWLRQDLQHAGS